MIGRRQSRRHKGGDGHRSIPAFGVFVTLILQAVCIAVVVAFVPLVQPAVAEIIPELLQRTHWGETTQDLLREFGGSTVPLTRSLDFGDSYADVVLNHETVGGVLLLVFFQMDKATHGLKRIQLERPHHGVNPPAFRAILADLRASYGEPDQRCIIPARPIGGYQAAAEERWVRGNDLITAIFRDTTLQAFEGCLFGITSGRCGLTGRLLVRISLADHNAEPDPCFLALHTGKPDQSR